MMDWGYYDGWSGLLMAAMMVLASGEVSREEFDRTRRALQGQ